MRDAPPARPHETLNAAVWMQLSAEYEASAIQAYNTALDHLSSALADSSWSAIPNATAHERKPPAIIVDVDETVLDNSPFEARMIRGDTVYNRPAWNAWVEERKAEAVPGALRFLNAAAELGVTVFYVTNRSSDLDAATTDNLRSEGFPLPEGPDQVLTRGERDEWTGDKATRRDHVATDYRVLFLAGDDLNDFVSTEDLSTEERSDLVVRYEDFWGERWIMLPNPTYGSWERTINREAEARYRSDRIRAKIGALRAED
ncbi:MAG: 5'-nucleotidase, lipoprotein e(P4) family [Acidimicrobiia bacterium]|nr:5'-nucleotidase, lipoprotein e(P4) family [Acidimicrobiia bacterium]